MWGNGMAFPCMLYIMEGVQEVLAERYSEIGRVVDKLTREKMISLHDFERKEKYHE